MESLKQIIRNFEYDYWANTAVIDTMRKYNLKDSKMELLFSHIINSQNVWLLRLQDKSPDVSPWEIIEPDNFCEILKFTNNSWDSYLKSLSPGHLAKTVEYKNTLGEKFSNTLHDIITHVLNHSTYHRSQISFLIKSQGFTPPVTDYIAFARLHRK